MKRPKILISLVVLTLMTAVVLHGQASSTTSFRQEGVASWYGPGFDGRPTASGEIFDSSKFTAAHPSLPFGTILTVTNTFNNRQVNVRVNDRGPFTEARIIDLSRAAAEVLDMISTGTATVIVESGVSDDLGPVSSSGLIQVPSRTGSTTPESPQVSGTATFVQESQGSTFFIGEIPQLGTEKHYRVQVGAYRVPRNAVDAFEKLKDAGLNPAYERVDNLYRVVLAGLSPEEIESLGEMLFSMGFAEVIIREEY